MHVRTRWLVWLSLLVGVVLWTELSWAQQPRHGGTLRIAFPGDPAFFDANQGPAPGAQAYWLSNSIYNSLLTLTPPPELQIVGGAGWGENVRLPPRRGDEIPRWHGF